MTAISNAQKAKHSSESTEWYSPPDIIERVHIVMGDVDLDPASCALANTVVRAKAFREGVGLPHPLPWHGRVWLNPPGGSVEGMTTKATRSATKVWWRRLVSEYRAGHIEQAMFLGFNLDCLQTTQDSMADGDAILDWPVCPRRGSGFSAPSSALRRDHSSSPEGPRRRRAISSRTTARPRPTSSPTCLRRGTGSP